MKKGIKLLALLLALCLLCLPFCSCASKKRPLTYMRSALERRLGDGAVGEILSLLFAALEEGSLFVSATGEPVRGIEGLDATLYFDRDEDTFFLSSDVLMGDAAYDADVWLSQTDVVVTSTALFGSSTVGMHLPTLKNDLAHSIFRNNSGTVFAKPGVGEGSAERVNTTVDGLIELYHLLEDALSLLDEHIDTFLSCLTKHANHTSYKEDGQVYLYLEVSNSVLSRALRDTWSEVTKDRSFCRTLRQIAKTADAIKSAKLGVVTTEQADKVETWLLGNTELEALCSKIDNSAPFTFTLNASAKAVRGSLTALSFHFVQEGQQELAFSLDMTEKGLVAVSLLKDGTDYKLTVKETEKKMRSYKAELTLVCAGEETDFTVNGTLALDKKSHTYSLALTAGEQVKTVTGTWQLKDDEAFLFSVEQLTQGDTVSPFTCRLEIKAKDKAPTAPAYLNIITATEERYLPLYQRMTDAKTAFLAAFGQEEIEAAQAIWYITKTFRF